MLRHVSLTRILVAFVVLEFVSGVLQGYYVPMFSDIGRHLGVTDAEVNWLESAQSLVGVLAIPLLAKLGDLFGYKRVLVWSAGLTAAMTLLLVAAGTFPLFLGAWALQGTYVIWLPLEVALIHSHTRGMEGRARVTTRAAATLVVALQLGILLGAIAGGRLVDSLPMAPVLLIPGLLALAGFAVVLLLVPKAETEPRGRIDFLGFCLLSLALLAFLGGLSSLRTRGAADPLPWLVMALGIALVVPFVLRERRVAEPLIDMKLLSSRRSAPIFVIAVLLGISLLGAQVPISTFMRADPLTDGFGLGFSGTTASLVIGLYVLTMGVGAALFPVAAKPLSPRIAMGAAAAVIGLGYLMLVLLHGSLTHMFVDMAIIGLGSGALIAALPAAAAAAAPDSDAGMATGLSNSSKALGGAVASSVFAMLLLQGTTAEGAGASLSGYLLVWSICAASAVVAMLTVLCFMPKQTLVDHARSA